MNYILFDDEERDNFLPLTFTNTVADLLIGMFTNRERWEILLGSDTSSITDESLHGKFPVIIAENNTLINSRLLPNRNMVDEINALKEGEQIVKDDTILALRIGGGELKSILDLVKGGELYTFHEHFTEGDISVSKSDTEAKLMEQIWDIFLLNGEVMISDLDLLEKSEFNNRSGEANQYIGSDVFIHKNATVNGAIFNTKVGPVIIDDGAEVMEGSILRGPIYIGKNAVVKMGAKIYGPTSVGAYSKVGGEVNNSVINAFSNKGHDGFIGNTVIGYWCNLGADTNTSNLKNDYSIVKLWNYNKESFVRSGLQFLGLVMGDHSKCGINTMFNTGTVVGVSCNVYGADFQPNLIPSFSWGKPGAFTTYQFDKAMQVAEKVMERRKKTLDDTEKSLLKEVFDKSESLRKKFH